MRKKGIIENWGINDSEYPVTTYANGKLIWICKIYEDWKSMIVRTRNHKFLEKNPTYVGCSVCEEWKYFSNFRKWVLEEQPNKNWENCMLDKDILSNVSKMYSPSTCAYVLEKTNQFFKDSAKIRGKYLIGVSKKDKATKFLAKCRNPFARGEFFSAYYDTEIEAHNAWMRAKHLYATELAKLEPDPRVQQVLNAKWSMKNDVDKS